LSRFSFIALMTAVVTASLAGCSKQPAAAGERKLLSSNGAPVATAPAPGGVSAPASPAAAAQAPAGQAPAGQAAAPAPALPKPMPAQLPDVLARVNGETISKTEFERALQSIEQRAGGPVPADRRDEIYRGLLDQLVGLKLLSQEAATRKVAVPDAEVDARIDAIKKQFPSEEVFKQQLTAQKMTLDKLRADQRADLAIAKVLEAAIKDKVTATPDQVIAFYQQNPTRFQQSERVRASHILLTVPQNADAATKAKVRAKAEDILKQVKAGGDFAALAKEHSQDPGSAINGGDLGVFQRGQMVGPFDDTAFKLAPGTVSDLVETQFGFHIIKVVEKQPARTVPIDEVKDQVKQYLENVNKQRETQAFVASLRSKGKVEVLV
jgi:peptidyl-prolyl cis-trans isomerase C